MKSPLWYKIDENHNITPSDVYDFETQDSRHKRVGLDEVGETRVSTVFLGLDHNWGDGPPILFETMVFSNDVDYDQYQYRYCTWDEAEKGHKLILSKVKNSEPLNTPRKTLNLNLKSDGIIKETEENPGEKEKQNSLQKEG